MFEITSAWTSSSSESTATATASSYVKSKSHLLESGNILSSYVICRNIIHSILPLPKPPLPPNPPLAPPTPPAGPFGPFFFGPFGCGGLGKNRWSGNNFAGSMNNYEKIAKNVIK